MNEDNIIPILRKGFIYHGKRCNFQEKYRRQHDIRLKPKLNITESINHCILLNVRQLPSCEKWYPEKPSIEYQKCVT